MLINRLGLISHSWATRPITTILVTVLCCLSFTYSHAQNSSSDIDIQTQNERLRLQSQLAIDNEHQAIIDAATPNFNNTTNLADTPSTNTLPQQNISPESAIFMAINQHNWTLLAQIIASYQQLPDTDVDMLLFANAALQAGKGDIATAIHSYQQLLQRQPDFIRARLDLARLYYQDGLLNQSQKEFVAVLTMSDLPEAVRHNIEAYLTVIDKKQAFSSVVTLGAGYERNINESSQSQTCLLNLPSGGCGYTRTTPDAIDSSALNIEATASRNWQVHDHHEATFNVLGYGTVYHAQEANDFDNSTLNLSTGYRYYDYNTEMVVTPLIEYRREENQKLYNATGARISVNQNLAQTVLSDWLKSPLRLSLNAEYKDFNYRDDLANNDGEQWSIYSNLFINTDPQSQWFVSLDYVDRDNADTPNAYQQTGVGIGHYKRWHNGLVSTLVARYRQREHDSFNALLDATREDKQASLYANLQIPQWRYYGFEPSISYQYRNNDSNVDWLYDYEASEVWFKLRRVF